MIDQLPQSDLLQAATALGAILATGRGVIWLGDRLWKQRPSERPNQSVECQIGHTQIIRTLDANTDALKEMVRALQGSVNDSNLRHQIVVDKLDSLKESIERLAK